MHFIRYIVYTSCHIRPDTLCDFVTISSDFPPHLQEIAANNNYVKPFHSFSSSVFQRYGRQQGSKKANTNKVDFLLECPRGIPSTTESSCKCSLNVTNPSVDAVTIATFPFRLRAATLPDMAAVRCLINNDGRQHLLLTAALENITAERFESAFNFVESFFGSLHFDRSRWKKTSKQLHMHHVL